MTMRPVRIAAILALLAGSGLVIDAVVSGRAQLALVLVFPVVSGASAEFLAGVALLFSGFVLLAFRGEDFLVPHRRPEAPSEPAEPLSASGGLVLIGPVPIFFGGWSSASRRTRWLVGLAGAALLVLLIVVALRLLG